MITKLVGAIAAIPEVVSMGKSGGPDLPPAGEGDIDIFVFCDTVSGAAALQASVCSLAVSDEWIQLSSSPYELWGKRSEIKTTACEGRLLPLWERDHPLRVFQASRL